KVRITIRISFLFAAAKNRFTGGRYMRNWLLATVWVVSGMLAFNRAVIAMDLAEVNALKENVNGLLGIKEATQSKEFSKLWSEMLDSVNTLRGFAANQDMPKDYADTLREDNQVLDDVISKDASLEVKLQLCRAVAKDLSVKVSFAQKHKETPFKMVA